MRVGSRLFHSVEMCLKAFFFLEWMRIKTKPDMIVKKKKSVKKLLFFQSHLECFCKSSGFMVSYS